MKIIKNFASIPPIKKTCTITIGNFDGMHKGHTLILKRLKKKASRGTSVVLTFNNHPSRILTPQKKIPLLCSPDYKLYLLKQAKIDIVILLKFTKALSQESFDHFISRLYKKLPFSSIILGEKSALRQKKRHFNKLQKCSRELNFEIETLPNLYYKDKLISSSLIRSYIKGGDLLAAKGLLARDVAYFFSKIDKKDPSSKKIILSLNDLCIPPEGIYIVHINSKLITAHLKNKKLELFLKDRTLKVPFIVSFQRKIERR